MNQLQRELFEQARRELEEVLNAREAAPRQAVDPKSEGQTIVLHGPVSIQRLVLSANQQQSRTVAPLRSENHELGARKAVQTLD